jgi:RNA polymerase sigma-70 factor (ECF subfamily)
MAPTREDIAAAYRRYAPALHRRCVALLGSAEDAHEVVHDSFVRYWSVAWRGEASGFTVLYRIATNAAIDRLRRRRTAEQVPPEPELPRSGRVADALDLARLVHGLADDDVTIAVLYHVDGYTQDEIASALELSRPTIAKAIARVTDHVRKRAARFAIASPATAARAATPEAARRSIASPATAARAATPEAARRSISRRNG